MKTIEEWEKLRWEDLEAAASAEKIPVPKGLDERIALTLAAFSASREHSDARPARRRAVTVSAFAAAAVLAALLALPRLSVREPKDTFDDPYLAYAAVEKAFQSISRKMSTGLELAKEVQPTADKPLHILEKINRQ